MGRKPNRRRPKFESISPEKSLLCFVQSDWFHGKTFALTDQSSKSKLPDSLSLIGDPSNCIKSHVIYHILYML